MRADGHDQLRASLVGEEERDVLAGARRSHLDVRDAQPLQAGTPRRAAVRVGVEHDLRRCPSRPAGSAPSARSEMLSMSPTTTSGYVARVEQRVRAAVHPDEHGLRTSRM